MRSQRKASAPSWLKEKPYIKVRFTQDGYISKETESWKLKLTEDGETLKGSLANYNFCIGQKVWCYWKTTDEKEKAYFEGEVIEMWENSTIVEENLPNKVDEPDEIVEDDKVEVEVEVEAKRQLVKPTIDNDEEDMLFDFMGQVMSRLESIEKKVDKLLQDKRKDHSLPVQVFLGKSGDSTASSSNRPSSPCFLNKSDTYNPPSPATIYSTPKASESPRSVTISNTSMDDDSLSEISCSLLDDVAPEISIGDTAESSSEDMNDMVSRESVDPEDLGSLEEKMGSLTVSPSHETAAAASSYSVPGDTSNGKSDIVQQNARCMPEDCVKKKLVSDLPFAVLKAFKIKLDPEREGGDYRDLAEKCGCSMDEIRYFGSKESPTEALLKDISPRFSIGKLFKNLELIGRSDALAVVERKLACACVCCAGS